MDAASGGSSVTTGVEQLFQLVGAFSLNNHLALYALAARDSLLPVWTGGCPRTILRSWSRADGVVGGPWAAANGAVPMVGSRAAQVDRLRVSTVCVR